MFFQDIASSNEEWSSEDDDIQIVLNVRDEDVVEKKEKARPRLNEYYKKSGEFSPSDPVALTSLKFVPPEEDPDIPPEKVPWRTCPATELIYYFNYGFTEAIWQAYKFKQEELRKLIKNNFSGSKATQKAHRTNKNSHNKNNNNNNNSNNNSNNSNNSNNTTNATIATPNNNNNNNNDNNQDNNNDNNSPNNS